MKIDNINIDRLKDAEGRITRWPKKMAEKQAVLEYLLRKFDKGKDYTEKEVNEIINNWHTFTDHPLLRREMIESGLLKRTNDGRRYWLAEKEEYKS
ncbi:MAG: DUF2087 domain-containing protein [Candidatus Delongbacteria bacterium]|nr:DUF2087 domain-containing protein [Candidatus Delongbacteria bacterium]